ncbi:MAG: hypothetical protein J6R00_10185, partial [Lentisphaeria bacterium]|nr:hypothetical protein [Lentisphaeria bacterium]
GTNTIGGSITLVNSSIESLGKIVNNGTITIDATSSITATSLTGTGTITIDTKGYTGETVKVIDVNQTAAITGVKLKDSTKKYYLTYEADGDVVLNKSPEFLYVSCDYNSSTEGWGVTHFESYAHALAFAKANAQKATIVMEKTTTISGNCLEDAGHESYPYIGVVVQDGALVGNANSKWDMTYAVTVEGGGVLQSGRPSSAGIGNTHIKNKLVIGDGSDKRAEVKFIKGSDIPYQTMSIALLSGINRSITANNALIELGDLGIQSTASFTDTELVADGIVAIRGTSTAKTTFTDSTVNIKGHNVMNEPTYYSTVGTILSTATLNNTQVVVDDGVEDTSAETVWLGYTGNVAQTLTLTEGSSITVEKGTEAILANAVTATDSEISVGYLNASKTKAESFYFNQLEKGKVYYAVIYDSEGNEIETITRTSLNSSTFSPAFSNLPAGKYKAVCYSDAEKTQVHQEKTYTFTAIGSLDLVNSDLTADTLDLANGNIKMDIDSKITFAKAENGVIEVKGEENYTSGNYYLFDYTGNGSMTEEDYKVLLNGQWHENYKVINNDLFLTDQETDVIYVNSAWTDKQEGYITDEGYIIGHNATSSLGAAANMIATDGTDTTIKFLGDISSEKVVDFVYGEGDITFTADAPVIVKQTVASSDWAFTTGYKNTITIGENVTFEVGENASGLYVYYGPSVKVEGTITGGANWGCTYLFNGDHVVESTGTISTGRIQLGYATLTVNGDAESDRTAAHID